MSQSEERVARRLIRLVEPIHLVTYFSKEPDDALMALGLALFVITFVVLALARLMLARLAQKAGA